MTINIKLKDNLEEVIQYPDVLWQHVILHTKLNQTILGYIPLHWHNDLQLTVVTHGKINIKIAGQNVILKENEGLFINTNIVHEIEDKEEDASFYCWNIGLPDATDYVNFKYVNEIINQIDFHPFMKLTTEIQDERILIEKVKHVGGLFEERGAHYQLNILSEYYVCLKQLITLIDRDQSINDYFFDPRVKDCINYIQEHYEHKIGMHDLSNVSEISNSETIKLFKKYVGLTPFQYLLHYRLEKAAKQLTLTSNNVTEVAMGCGFSTTSYFIQVFKEKYHVTTKQFQLLH